MPKLAPSALEQSNRQARAIISYGMDNRALTEDDLAKKLGCTKRTVQNKRRNPGSFTLQELRIAVKALGLSDEQKAQLLS